MYKNFYLKNRFELAIIIIISFFVNFYYSSFGVLPQDTFAFYDTGYRVLNGATPFNDYWTVSGPIIDYIQAVLFYLFGTSWKIYILSGSILNCLISLLFYFFLKVYKLENKLSLFYVLCFSILANPSMGSPFPDHFSAFFSLAGVFLFLIAAKLNNRIFWLLIPFLFFIAFFSKQSPSSYLFLVILIISIIYLLYFKKFDFIKYFFLSSVICFSFLFLYLIINNIDYENFLIQYIFFPKTIADGRIENFLSSPIDILLRFKFIFMILLILISILFFQIFKNKNIQQKEFFLINFSLFLTSLSLIFHQVLTKNFIFIFFLIPIICSLLNLYLLKYLNFNKRYISIFFISFTLVLTTKYHLRFNEDRKMLNLEKIDLDFSTDAKNLDPSLKGLKWITKENAEQSSNEIEILKEGLNVIKKDKSNKMMMSGYLFFSAITEEDLNNPSRWPSIGDASNPNKLNMYHDYYKNFIKNLILKKQIKSLYSTWDNKDDIFLEIFKENCIETIIINDFLTKHDITNCY